MRRSQLRNDAALYHSRVRYFILRVQAQTSRLWVKGKGTRVGVKGVYRGFGVQGIGGRARKGRLQKDAISMLERGGGQHLILKRGNGTEAAQRLRSNASDNVR
eukprot:1228916-Rhodomonas_salina.2